jgi:hypothetical protein
MTKSTIKKAIEVKNEDSKQNGDWSKDTILSNIFKYVNHKDILEFSTVCKKWNSTINPIIYKTIKLNCKSTLSFANSSSNDDTDKCDAEVVECILNNSKHAQFVKEFKYKYRMESRRAIEFFQTFRFISTLTIHGCNMSQVQFLGMISPLTQLQELNLSSLSIINTFGKIYYNEVIQLPQSLKKLKIGIVVLMGNPELFIQAINSHRSLVEFSANSSTSSPFLEPFYKKYPSLLNFEYENLDLQTPRALFKIFENNTQLISLVLSMQIWSSELVSHISSYLINLEQVKFSENGYYNRNNTDFFTKFSQPTKIKKLNLHWGYLSSCSLNSILLNCPHLEELDLNSYSHYKQANSIRFFNLSNPGKLKKLAIDCDALGEGVFESLLLRCLHLNELSIILPYKWKEAIKSIYEKCANLQRLIIYPSYRFQGDEIFFFFQEFYQTQFFTYHPKCKSTLTHLALKYFKVQDSKAEYFKNFENLKSIKYLNQHKNDFKTSNLETEIEMDLWPDYRLLSKITGYTYDIELRKIT